MEIMKSITSDHTFNIMQNKNQVYQILQPLQDQKTTSTDVYKDALIGMN